MKISTKGRYSVTALYELALRYGEGAVSLKSIATSQGLSENYLEQLMAPLRRAGIVKSVRGAQGGYCSRATRRRSRSARSSRRSRGRSRSSTAC